MNNSSNISELETRAPSTKRGHEQGISKWNEFARLQLPQYPQFHLLSDAFVCGKVLPNGSIDNANNPPIRECMTEFANFLLNRKVAGGKYHTAGAVGQYFSTFKATLFKKFKPLGCTGASPDWYMEVYHGLCMRASTAAIKRGEKIRKKAVGMPRAKIIECCDYLLSLNDAQSYEDRTVLSVLYSACGQSGGM